MDSKFNLKTLETSQYIYFNPTKIASIEDIKTIVELNNTFKLPNEANVNDNYKNLSEYIYRIIKNSNFLCKGLNASYVRDAFANTDAILVVSSSGVELLPNGNIFGFALLNFDETDNSIYIDVICSHSGIKYAGEVMINKVLELCEMLFIRKIKLNSVASAISFYEKYGFVKRSDCSDSNQLCKMERIYKKKAVGGKRKKTKRKQNKKRKNTRKRV
jgi:predicted GNAT family N-acyltransferase